MNTPNSRTGPARARGVWSSSPTLARIGLVVLALAVLNNVWRAIVGVTNLSKLTPPSSGRDLVIGWVVIGAALPLVCLGGLLWRQMWARVGWVLLTLLEIAFLVVPPMILMQPVELPFAPTAVLVAQVAALCLLFINTRGQGPQHGKAVHA